MNIAKGQTVPTGDPGIRDMLTRAVYHSEGENLSTKLPKFEIEDESTYLLMLEKGINKLIKGDGEANSTKILKEKEVLRLFTDELDTQAAVMTDKIKTNADARAFMTMQEVF
jgi:putative sterol carrier protein